MPNDDAIQAPPDLEESAYERYFLRDPGGVLALLRRMVEQRCTVTVVAEDAGTAPTSVVSALLGVDGGQLWVDVPRVDSLLQRLVRCGRLTFDSHLDCVHVRFQSGPASLAQHGGYPALRLPLPDGILHLQRRELMRRDVPAGTLRCTVSAADAERPVEATVRDIGGGGLALLMPAASRALQVGDVLKGCRIEGPDIGPLDVDLEVCHLREARQRAGTLQQAGCRFLDLPPPVQSRLFRYLMQLDRERLARR